MRKTMHIIGDCAYNIYVVRNAVPVTFRTFTYVISDKKNYPIIQRCRFPLLCDIGGETCGVFIVTVFCENSILFSDSVLKK